MNKLRTFLSAAALLSLCACQAVGPDYQLPAGAKARDSKAQKAFDLGVNSAVTNDSADLKAWWQAYRSPQLNQLIELALANNADLRVAYHNLRQAYAKQQQAEHADDVLIASDAAAGPGQLSSESLALPYKLPVMDLADVGVDVSYQLDLFGKLQRATEAATANTEATQALLAGAQLTIISQVAHHYLQSCHLSHELALAEQGVALQLKQQQVIERLYAAGRGSAVDVEREKSQTEMLRAALPNFRANKADNLYQLAALLGRTPNDLPQQIKDCQRAPELTQPIPVGDGAALIKRRPDIRQAERELAAATAQIGVAIAEMYPQINLTGGAGFTGMIEHIGDPITRAWHLMPTISWHFPTERDRARVRAREAGADAALAHFDGVVLNALKEVQTALKYYEQELQRYSALVAAQQAANTAAQDNRRLYREGRLNFVEILASDRALLQAQSAVAASQARISALQIQLLLTLGGGWQ